MRHMNNRKKRPFSQDADGAPFRRSWGLGAPWKARAAAQKFLALALCFSACGPVADRGGQEILSTSVMGAREIWSMCHTSQGNGFNWASSLGWLSEALTFRAAEMMKLDETAAASGVSQAAGLLDVGCFSGSSSAAATTALFATLLANRQLVTPRQAGSRLLVTAKEADRLARALRFVALDADFTAGENAQFALRYLVPEVAEGQTRETVWWKSQYGEKLVTGAFSRRILLASLVRPADLSLPLPARVRQRTELFPEVLSVTDLAVISGSSPTRPELPQPGSATYRELMRLVEAQSATVKQRARELLAPFGLDPGPAALARLKQLPVPQGFLTSVFVSIGERVSTSTIAPAFSESRILYLTGEATAQTLLSSPEFVAQAGPGGPLEGALVASVSSVFDMMRLSVAEPENQGLISGNARELGILRLGELKDGLSGWLPSRLDLAVLGGWTHYADAAWPLVALAAQKVGIEAGAVAVPSRTVISRFGKPARTARFPGYVIAKYFAANPDGTAPSDPAQKAENERRYTDLYYRRAESFDRYASEALEAARAAHWTVEVSGFNWDIAQRPGAAAGLSQTLMLKAINHFRSQTAAGRDADLPLTFDPRPVSDYGSF